MKLDADKPHLNHLHPITLFDNRFAFDLPRRYFCCNSCLYVHSIFDGVLFCTFQFIQTLPDVLDRLCSVVIAFPGYTWGNIYFRFVVETITVLAAIIRVSFGAYTINREPVMSKIVPFRYSKSRKVYGFKILFHSMDSLYSLYPHSGRAFSELYRIVNYCAFGLLPTIVLAESLVKTGFSFKTIVIYLVSFLKLRFSLVKLRLSF